MKDLSHGEIKEQILNEYESYLDMEELPEDFGEELHDWEIDLIKDNWAIMELRERIDPPKTLIQLNWMADFANEQLVGGRFVRDVQKSVPDYQN